MRLPMSYPMAPARGACQKGALRRRIWWVITGFPPGAQRGAAVRKAAAAMQQRVASVTKLVHCRGGLATLRAGLCKEYR
jgi:hypothetical protein